MSSANNEKELVGQIAVITMNIKPHYRWIFHFVLFKKIFLFYFFVDMMQQSNSQSNIV